MEADAPSPSLPAREWDEQLRARGYRVTPQRQLVLEAVARLDHATPEEIGTQVQQTARGVNISTIYRTLELLEQIGMVTHTHLAANVRGTRERRWSNSMHRQWTREVAVS